MFNSVTTKGYSLVEVLVAISILLLALVGPMTIAVKGLQSSYYAREQTTALFLAQEGIELVVAMRNESLVQAITDTNSTLSDGWNWVDEGNLDDCFVDDGEGGDDGCNISLRNTGNYNYNENQPVWNSGNTLIKSCSDTDDCMLRFDDGAGRARYNLNSGDDTIYTRVIKLESMDDDSVKITATVTWDARLFSGAEQKVVLESAVYRIYDDQP